MTLVRYELIDSAGWITLNDPERGNAVSLELGAELAAAVGRARADGVHVIVLRAEGRFFCVGGDLAGFAAAESLPDHMREITNLAHRAIADLIHGEAIVVASVQGVAAGIGFPLAMAADLVVAADTAGFTLGYTKVGLTGDGGTGLLVRSIGLHRALRLALLNDLISAEEAHRIGLVARVVPADELESHTAEIVTTLTSGSHGAQSAIRRIIRTAAGMDVENQLSMEACAMTGATEHPDALEGVSAFLAKRAPAFGGFGEN